MSKTKYAKQRLPLNASRGHKRLAKVLNDIFNSNGVSMSVWYEYSLRDMGDSGDAEYYGVEDMAVDFYIKELDMAIEYQGEQHYSDNSFFKGQMSRDKRKREFLQDLGITLIEIPYYIGDNFTTEDIKEKLGLV